MSNTRFEDLKKIGWANLDYQQRKEYQKLKKAAEAPETTTNEPKKGQKPDEMWDLICEKMWKEVLDGDVRAMILEYKERRKDMPYSDVELLTMMRDSAKASEHKAVFQKYIMSYE